MLFRSVYWTWPDAPRFFPDFLLHALLWPLAPDLLANTLIPTLVLQAAIAWLEKKEETADVGVLSELR